MLDTQDLVVVGAGGAGLAAAYSARLSGASVTVLEKSDTVGGTTAMSIGSFTAAGTRYQRHAGVNDDHASFVSDMVRANGAEERRENKDLRQILACEAGSSLEWLSEIGVQFLGPTPEPPYRHPRMHNVIPNSKAYTAALERACRRLGVRIDVNVPVLSLAMDGGRVVGVETENGSYAARKGVILASGDYSNSSALKRTYVSDQSARVPGVNPYSTGDGFIMALKAGAAVRNMDRTVEQLRFYPPRRRDPIKSLPANRHLARTLRRIAEILPDRFLGLVARAALASWIAPEKSIFDAGAILIGPRGNRIANEDDPTQVARMVAAEPENRCFIIFDERVSTAFSGPPNHVSTFPGIAYAYLSDYKRYRPDVCRTAKTLAALASAIDVPADTLRATVVAWNAQATNEEDVDFGRLQLGTGLLKPPFTALGPLKAVTTATDGGLLIDGQCRVLRDDGTVIDGLWAAGSVGQGGLVLANHGLHLAWAFTSGRIAGRNVAEGE